MKANPIVMGYTIHDKSVAAISHLPHLISTALVKLAYQRYMLKNWQYFIIRNGNCNNLNLGITLSRVSTDNQLFPRRGSEFMTSITITPPWSLWDGKDYKGLTDIYNAEAANGNYYSERATAAQKEKYSWIEYYKWKFRSKTYTALTNGAKCFVLMTRVENL